MKAEQFHAYVYQIIQESVNSGDLKPGEVIATLEVIKLDIYSTIRKASMVAAKSSIIKPRG